MPNFSNIETHVGDKPRVTQQLFENDKAIDKCSSAAILVGHANGLSSHVSYLVARNISTKNIFVCEHELNCFNSLVRFNNEHLIIPKENILRDDLFKIAAKHSVDHIDADTADSGIYSFEKIKDILKAGQVKSIHWTIVTRANPLVRSVIESYGWTSELRGGRTYWHHPKCRGSIDGAAKNIFGQILMRKFAEKCGYDYFQVAYEGAGKTCAYKGAPMLSMVFSKSSEGTE